MVHFWKRQYNLLQFGSTKVPWKLTAPKDKLDAAIRRRLNKS